MVVLASKTDPTADVGDTFAGQEVVAFDPNGNPAWRPFSEDVSATAAITADPAPAAQARYVTAYAGAFTLPALTAVGVGDRVELVNEDGQAVVITPQPGEALNGNPDATWFSDSAGQHVVATATATGWAVGPNVVTAETGYWVSQGAGFTAVANGIVDVIGVIKTDVGAGITYQGGGIWDLGPGRWRLHANGMTQTNNTSAAQSYWWAETSNLNSTASLGTVGNGYGNTAGNTGLAGGADAVVEGPISVCRVAGSAGTNAQSGEVVIEELPRTYQAGTLVAEPARDLLMDATGSVLNGDTIPFLGGHTRASVVAEYERIEFWVGDLKQTGNNQRNDWPVTSHPVEALEPNAAGDGFLRVVEGLQDVHISDAGLGNAGSTGLTFSSSNNDGVYVLKMWGVRPQFNAIRAEDAPVNDQAASGYFDVGTMRMQWGVEPGGIGVGSQTLTFPAPFATGSSPTVTLTSKGGATNSGYIRLNGTPNTTSVDLYRDSMNDSGSSWTAGDEIHWMAIGLKPTT